jgi:hypothetical protein
LFSAPDWPKKKVVEPENFAPIWFVAGLSRLLCWIYVVLGTNHFSKLRSDLVPTLPTVVAVHAVWVCLVAEKTWELWV